MMTAIGTTLGLIGLGVAIGGIVWLILRLIRRGSRRVPAITLGAGLIAFVVGLILTPADQSSTTAQNTEASATPRPTPTPTATRSPTPTATPRATPLYPDQQRKDRVTSFGQSVTLSGMQVTVTNPRQERESFLGPKYCVDAAYQNVDSRTRRFSYTDWKLQLPNGVVDDAGFNTRQDALGSTDLIAGGNVKGSVCFDDQGTAGQYVLIWKPDLFDAARGIWLIDR